MIRILAVLSIFLVTSCAPTVTLPPSSKPEQTIPGTQTAPMQEPRPAGPLPPSTRPTYNLGGYPPATKEGYIDGCETAKKTPYGYKDQQRYLNDAQYRMGWEDGFAICQPRR